MSETKTTISAGLSPKQLQVIQALASGSNVSAAATATGVHRSSIYNWCANLPHFRAALRTAKTIHAETVQEGLRGLSDTAVATLRAVLENEATPASVRLRAALAVIKSVEAQHPSNETPSMADFDRFVDAATMQGADRAAWLNALSEIQHNSTEFDTSEHFSAAAA